MAIRPLLLLLPMVATGSALTGDGEPVGTR
jgi:hypothetical protein